MSLLNDALRKKNREKRPPVGPTPEALADTVPRPQRRRLLWIAGVGAVVVIAVVAGVVLIGYAIETPTASELSAPADFALAESRPMEAERIPSGTPLDQPSSHAIPDADPSVSDSATAVGSEDDDGGQPTVVTTAVVSTPSREEDHRGLQAEKTVLPERPHPRPGEPTPRDAPAPSMMSPDEDHRQDAAAEPALVERYYRKALSYHQQGRLSRAIDLYRDALQLQPDHADAQFNLVSAYIESGAFEPAHRIAQTLYRQDSANPQILTNLAVAQIGLGRYREALALLDRTAEMPRAEMFTVLLHKGIACRGLGQLDAAIGWYRKAEQLRPEHPQLLFNLALAYDRQQAFRQALQYYRAYRDTAATEWERDGVGQRISALRSYLAVRSKEPQDP